jgi:hypothetical protein
LGKALRPKAETLPQDLRRTRSAILWRRQIGAKWRAIPRDSGPWWRAAPIFTRSRGALWELLLGLAQGARRSARHGGSRRHCHAHTSEGGRDEKRAGAVV